MPKLRVFSGAELCNLLTDHGFERVRQRSSHVVMRRGPVSLPVPLQREIDRGLCAEIIRQSRLPRSLFEKYLIVTRLLSARCPSLATP
jgi:predicted RNA binding protein YcfA (HicA-like mRNA interferase family)